MTVVDDRLLESKMTKVEQARAWSPRVMSKFETLIRSARYTSKAGRWSALQFLLDQDPNLSVPPVLAAVLGDGIEAVEAACQEALDQNVFSSAVIINILARRRDPAPAITILTPDALRLQHEPQADCARYDSLRRAS